MADLDSASASSNQELDRENLIPNIRSNPDILNPIETPDGVLYEGSFDGTIPPENVNEIPPLAVEANTEINEQLELDGGFGSFVPLSENPVDIFEQLEESQVSFVPLQSSNSNSSIVSDLSLIHI